LCLKDGGKYITKKHTIEYIEKFVESIGGIIIKNQYYVNNRCSLKMICTNCGKEFETTFDSIKSKRKGTTCISCSALNQWEPRKHSIDFMVNEYKKIGYILREDKYIGVDCPMVCEDCDGYFGTISYTNVKGGKFFGKFKENNPFYLQNLQHFANLNDFNCKILKTYKQNNRQMVEIKCSCGEIFSSWTNSFLRENKYRCSECSKLKSRYAKKTSDFLDELKVLYEEEIKIEGCKYKRNLAFDFQVIINDHFFLIEVDGQFHYVENNMCENPELALLEQNKKDRIKDKFCKENDIDLLRIPYWEFENENYKHMIKDTINKHNQIEK
jgi:hypothetical protein